MEKVALIFKPVYILHHAVLRKSSSPTKLRVIFNASCKTRNGTSLNHLLVGPLAVARSAGHNRPMASMALCILRISQKCSARF